MKPVDVKEERKVKTAVVFTHSHPEETAEAVSSLNRIAAERQVEVWYDSEETEKHGLATTGPNEVKTDCDLSNAPDICIAFGGDGTVLYGLRKLIGQGVPVFAVNFGRIGFLSTVDRDQLEEGIELALEGRFETMELPALSVVVADNSQLAFNDVAFLRKPHSRVADLAYSLANEPIGDVRCDGLVAATPAGSTGYNLANGGPILAWGVEGYVISFVAPHTLTARPLLAAASDDLKVINMSKHDAVTVNADGREICDLGPGNEAIVTFKDRVAQLAQLPGSNFYRRFREKFG